MKTIIILFLSFLFINTSLALYLTQPLSIYSKDEDTNNEVSKLQLFLKQNTCSNLKVTGYFDIRTRSCLRKFQRDNNLSPTGSVNTRTRAIINSLSNTNLSTSTNTIETSNKCTTDSSAFVLEDFTPENGPLKWSF